MKGRNVQIVKNVGKAIVFLLILGILLSLSAQLLKPLFKSSYDRTSGFYEQKDDTIEVALLGSSVLYCGISPNELYADYGICAYNLATNAQPVLTSYYRLLETYELHSESLKTVVLEVSMMLRGTSEENYQNALWGMQSGFIQAEAAMAITDSLEDFLVYVFPLSSWHSRWKELKRADFKALNPGNNRSWLRGYYYSDEQAIEETDPEDIGIPAYLLCSDNEATLNEEAAEYMEQIVSFCDEKGIELILIKTPATEDIWKDAKHNAVAAFADEYDLAFIDFNYSPYLDEISFNAATDLIDEKHLNYSGMMELTSWIGNYLTENCDLTDVRGLDGYGFMEEDLQDYQEYLQQEDEAQNENSQDQEESDIAEKLTLYTQRCEEAYAEKLQQGGVMVSDTNGEE